MFSSLFGGTTAPPERPPPKQPPRSAAYRPVEDERPLAGEAGSGVPDADTISRQKTSYLTMLDEQVAQGTAVLDTQVQHQKEYLRAQADQQKKQFVAQIDLEVGGERWFIDLSAQCF